MKKEHKSYDEDFKKTIVNLCESGKRKSELVREYGISYTNISDWIKKYGTKKQEMDLQLGTFMIDIN